MAASERASEMWIRKYLKEDGLPFREFVDRSLYDDEFGYYTHAAGALDYATSVHLSPVFAFSLARVAAALLPGGGDGLYTIVDIGCGDGSLLAGIRDGLPEEARGRARFLGIDRTLDRLRPELTDDPDLRFAQSIDAIDPAGPAVVFSNELFDALPFARLVQRESGLHELWVVAAADGSLEWDEREAPEAYAGYLEQRGIRLEPGQFADVSLEWGALYEAVARRVTRGALVTIDYGFPQEKLFDVRVRRYGTAAAFHRHRVHRDLLARPGEQDLTAHVNFTDLRSAGERQGWTTVAFERQARFLLAAGAAGHPLLAPLGDVEATTGAEALELAEMRDAARRLVLPDGIGDEMRVLVQVRGVEQRVAESLVTLLASQGR